MKHTRLLSLLFISSVIALLAAGPLHAQDKQKSDENRAESTHSAAAPVSWYKIDITVSEFDDGKKVNSRRYIVHLNDRGDRSVTDFGTRVPVTSGNGQFNYIDVGLNVNLRIIPAIGERSMLEMGFELSSFAIPEQAKQTAPGVPILRRVRTSNSIPVMTAKPLVVASLDDPNSTKRYEFEATVTKL